MEDSRQDSALPRARKMKPPQPPGFKCACVPVLICCAQGNLVERWEWSTEQQYCSSSSSRL
jgi:hypothetical protein